MPTTPLPTTHPAEELHLALADRRVTRALHLALRDVQLRRRFARMRGEGLTVDEAVGRLLGPHEDERGRGYYLSEERVRAIVYRKG